jgi:DsbC/DsbD-like thiol-disulfide interchange protein/cytochrome c biogenesis protein CcdA
MGSSEASIIVRGAGLAALLFIAPAAHAAESAPVASSRAVVSLVSETDSYRPGAGVQLGLRFRLAPGWHIYWQNPGDAGVPPDIAWTLPAGAKAGGIEWPAPTRAMIGPVMSYVYSGDLVLPATVTPPTGTAPLEVQADAHWLVCANICVPEQGSFHLSLPPGKGEPGPAAPLFAAAAARQPQPDPFAASIAPDGSLSVAGQGLSPATIADAWFFPAAWGAIDQNAPQPLTIDRGAVVLALKPGAQFDAGQGLDGLLVLRDPKGNESFLTLHALPGVAPPAGLAGLGFARALLLALAGGLILNLMPCVFPVLAMKALAIARLSGHEHRAVRAHALSYTAGVLAAFLALGGVLLGLRSAGAAVGWGFQFQSPLFVAAMAWLMAAIGLNLSGVFEIGARFAGAGQALSGRGGHAGSFATGLLAVVVATPCTAPFMGAALAAAVTAPPALAIGIFGALGLGLALPYTLLAAVPRLAALLPRPGRWMLVLRKFLAIPMDGAALWLLWVASQQSGPVGAAVVAGGMALLGVGAWLLGRAQHAEGPRRRTHHALALAAALAAIALLPLAGTVASGPAQAAANDGSEPFSDATLASLRAAGRPVFVDMTAAWCVTCLVNERVALTPREVRDAFAAHQVAYLKGDWTREDPAITRFLRAAGRDGVPLYVYYPPRGEPVVLPQILTPSIVLAQLQK